MPARVELQATVAVPDPVKLLGVMVPQTSPDGIESERDTDPPNWFRAVIVMVEEPFVPAFLVTGFEAVIVKSWNWNVAVAVWTSCPFLAVIVSV